MSFQQGLSGLAGASKSLDVIGNNVANASTVGFKSAQAQFADMYANSMNRSGNSPVGIGVTVANVQQAFTQGNVTTTNNPLDIAINGDGFFRMQGSLTDSSPLYGRNGQFQLDKNGYIINPSEKGAYLTGWLGTVTGGDPVPLQIDTSNIPATQTTNVASKLNLDSRLTGIAPATTPFVFSDTSTYNSTTGVTVYDSLGNSYNVQTYYVKNATTSTATTTDWDVYTTVDGVAYPAFVAPATQAKVGTLTFDSNGILTSAQPAATLNLTAKAGASFAAAGITLNYTGTTQTGAAFATVAQSQDGKGPGVLSSFSIGKDGLITGSYSNGDTKTLGQVLLVNFANPNGLQPLGSNLYTATSDAGTPLIGTPTTGQFGVLQARSVEDSNVDLTTELVNMIVAQRVYQANSQTIKVQDTVLQTLVSLR
ncbi:flagellar hook-basal body protein [Herbaspirillum sp. CF444]|uniref:flagellar hook protein FlgE n=1 Tax=Herbaspirillum sp. CF444 TaxID=1144319 RepID=UPI0002726EEA|nr:flagellar hook protein FlgE [Herbaspirillum sp. CF444]EJL84184.1 flagellar hook-basal body protein [Herbaspirillum sp. CF444]